MRNPTASLGRTALDVQCPECDAPCGAECQDPRKGRFHSKRLKLTVAITREQNRIKAQREGL